MKDNVLILGTGAWGTAIASVLLHNKIYTKMYGISKTQISDLKKSVNTEFFKNIKLANRPNEVSNNLKELFKDVKYVIFCVPTKNYLSVINDVKKFIKPNMVIINTSKGLSIKNNKSYYQILLDKFPNNKVCSIIGPSYAKEVVLGKQTMINIIGNNKSTINNTIKLFNNEYFKLIVCNDQIGSSAYSAIKNILAIIMGILNGLDVSINTKSAILTIGIQESINLIKILGGKDDTISSLAGIGDIFLTCTDKQSRNFSFGFNLASQKKTKKTVNKNDVTVEGVEAIKNIYNFLNKKKKISRFPLFNLTYNVVYGKIDTKDFVNKIWKML